MSNAQVTTIQDEVVAAEADEQAATARADALALEVKQMAIDAFTTTSDDDSMLGMLGSASADDMSHGSAFLESRAADRASLLGRYRDAADERHRAVEGRRELLVAAQSAADQQQHVVDEIAASKAARAQVVSALDDRVESAMSEADSVARVDPAAAARLVKQQKALRAAADVTGDAPTSSTKTKAGPNAPKSTPRTTTTTTTTPKTTTTKPAPTTTAKPGSRTTTTATTTTTTTTTPPTPVVIPPPVDLVTVNGIQVARSLSGGLLSLMSAASSAGFTLGGSGYRDPSSQVALRTAHCGPTPYDIYDRPPAECSPPTARPGRSMHEQGLAVDFTCNGALLTNHADPCWIWMSQNAARFGLFNLASEPWHWSINGN